MSVAARIYLWSVLVAGALLAILAFWQFNPTRADWPLTALLIGLACVAQLFRSDAPLHQRYHPTLMFSFAGLLLLQPAGFVALIVAAHLVEWIRERLTGTKKLLAWYGQPFNVSMHIILGFLAAQVFRLLNPLPGALTTGPALAAVALAALVYAALNHLMVGAHLALTKGVPWKTSGALEGENILTDYILLIMGYLTAILARINLWLILPAVLPLYLVRRALAIPYLLQLISTDSKTGLWDAKYFTEALEREMNRARRNGYPLTVVMADLDLLRNINSTYGHLGGDAVLIGAARILRSHFREYDVVARFGGEEFAILMPETTPEQALGKIDRVRTDLAQTPFEAPATRARIRATMSFGMAGINGEKMNLRELLHCADIAVYQAKLDGRNRVRIFSRKQADEMGLWNLEETQPSV